jgi:radical SAM protein with 4Fe4S-binding SPASM domain
MQFEYLEILFYIMAAIFLIGSSFRIMKEYERAVIFRLGKYLKTKGPGLIFIIPLIDRPRKVDLRLVSIDVPRQEIMTRDNVPVTIDAVVYFKIIDPAAAIIVIQQIYQSTFLIAQSTLRNILGQAELDDLLSQQTKINRQLQEVISIYTAQWGIEIPIVEIKEVTLPEEMKRAMAKQAETERKRRALIICAQGEYQAAQTLAEAGKILSDNPQSLQLRYLETLRDLSVQKGSTIVFPFPLDMLGSFMEGIKKGIQKDRHLVKEEAAQQEKSIQDEVVMEERPGVIAPMPETIPQAKRSEDTITQTRIDESSLIARQREYLLKYQREWRAGGLKPEYVQWLSTDRCQFQCAHCETTSQKTNPRELKTKEVKKILDQLKDMGCEFFSMSGGEPLLREDIFDLCDYAHKKGIRVGLTTNGQAVEDNLLALEKARFDSLVITLDGHKDIQNRIRNSKDAYDRGIKTIEFFHDLGAPSIGVSTILLEDNIQDFPRLTEDAFRAGTHSLHLQPLMFQNGQPTRNSSETVKNAFRFVLEARRRGFNVELSEAFGCLGPLEPYARSTPFFCGSGWNTFCLNPEGEVIGCALAKFSGKKEGNCQTDSLKKIWEQKFTQFRQNIPSGVSERCKECPNVSICRGGCWLFRAQGMNPCFYPEAEQIYREIADALYSKTNEGKSQVLS